jgi:POLQ-like helicase
MSINTHTRARDWPYPRYGAFRTQVEQAAAQWFAEKDYIVHQQYAYCLPKRGDWLQNLILPDEVGQYVEAERAARRPRREGFPLHKWAHHGLSSQVMLLNLVGPLVVRNDMEPLREAFTQAGIPWPSGTISARFEVENRKVFKEAHGQPTSIDLVIDGELGSAPLYVEAKFVEQEFGVCSVFEGGDCDGRNPASDHSMCYLHHIGREYWTLLEKHGFLRGALASSPTCAMSSYYQFFREVLFAVYNHGYFVLLYDERNPTFVRDGAPGRRGLLPFLTSLVPEDLRERIKSVTVQMVFAAIVASGQHDDWRDKFARKYGLSEEQNTR